MPSNLTLLNCLNLLIFDSDFATEEVNCQTGSSISSFRLRLFENDDMLRTCTAAWDLFHYIPPTAKRGDIVKRY